jgi:NAD(P)-dependent dehydrogenase (short-subunit alcohol dehydrogenase family)
VRGLKDKGVFITGGTRGIGFATAQRFLVEGARVYLCGRSRDNVGAAVSELREFGDIDGTVADVSAQTDVDAVVGAARTRLGRIDILINNAGIAWDEPFLEITPDHWDQIINTNLRGMFLVGQAVARAMVADRKGGAIVNMSSTNGVEGEEKYAHYNASKGGVTLLTKTMALELGAYGIRVNAVCPGYIVTPMSEAIDDPSFVEAYVREKIPVGRVGRPEDVAAAYAFLASDDAAFIHGACLLVDGGQLAS